MYTSSRRFVDPAQLVSSHEISERIGQSQSLIAWWTKRRYLRFPEPVAVVGRRPLRLWLWPEVEAWAITWGYLEPAVPTAVRVPVESSGRIVSSDDLITAAEIAEMRGWGHPSNAIQLSRRGTFPTPVTRIGTTWVWLRSEVETWSCTHPPRRRKHE